MRNVRELLDLALQAISNDVPTKSSNYSLLAIACQMENIIELLQNQSKQVANLVEQNKALFEVYGYKQTQPADPVFSITPEEIAEIINSYEENNRQLEFDWR